MVITKNLVDHFEMTEVKMFESRLNAIKEIQNNALGVEVGQFDGAYAFSIKNIPGPSYNVVKGDSLGSENTIDKILSFYRAREIPARFDLAPQYVNATSLQKLHNAGLFQSDFHATLYCELNEETMGKTKDSPIKIRQIKEDEFDCYGNIYAEGFGMPAFLAQSVATNNQVLHDKPGWSFYIASLHNEDVGVGSLYVNNGTAILAASAVKPTARNQGIHQAFIQFRINKALKQNCSLMIGHAKFASISQNNMERCGLKMAYTKSIWTEAT
ncbi:GNAT family N-acetyltransferase [Lysinibacillus sp. NPDC093688]|uniref:GNAT family N-acetyltransferase n=1 Tax=Lysinibacillus sp. NPDC093688 TaxID=3390577 RepID=UPI003D065EA9